MVEWKDANEIQTPNHYFVSVGLLYQWLLCISSYFDSVVLENQWLHRIGSYFVLVVLMYWWLLVSVVSYLVSVHLTTGQSTRPSICVSAPITHRLSFASYPMLHLPNAIPRLCICDFSSHTDLQIPSMPN